MQQNLFVNAIWFLFTNYRRRFGAVVTIALFLVASACDKAAPGLPQKRYELTGKVVAVDKRGQMVTIAHQEVPGLMDAMTMSFMLKADWAFDVINPGDEISAALVVEGDRSWLEEPAVTRSTTISASAPDSSTGSSPPLLSPGDQLPDFALVNQDDQKLNAARYRGRALLLTFIYTRCPLPDYCILMNDNFAEINQTLNERPELRDKTQLLSISIDPAHDTPPVLREHGLKLLKNNKRGFKGWEFATGSAEDVRQLAERFGLQYMPQQDQIIHSLRTAIIKPDGTIFKIYNGNKWTTAEALKDLDSLRSDK